MLQAENLSNDVTKNGNLSYDDRTDPLLLDQKGGGDIVTSDIAGSDIADAIGGGKVFGHGSTSVLTAKLVGQAISEEGKSQSGNHGHDHDADHDGDHEHGADHDHDHSNHSDHDHSGTISINLLLAANFGVPGSRLNIRQRGE